MEIRKEINDFYALADMVWSGAVDTIADICEDNDVNEWEVIGAVLDAIEDMGIDITEYM